MRQKDSLFILFNHQEATQNPIVRRPGNGSGWRGGGERRRRGVGQCLH